MDEFGKLFALQKDCQYIMDKPCKSCWHQITYMPVAEAGCIAEDKGRRGYMEDTHVIATLDMGKNGPGYLYGVFDGHGGDQTAKILTHILPRYLAKTLQKVDIYNRKQVTNAIQDAYIRIDKCFYDQKVLGGSTAIVAIYSPKVSALYLINLGDSRAVVWSGEAIRGETTDHKPLAEKVRIESAGGFVALSRVAGILAVARAFGDAYHPGSPKAVEGLKVIDGVYKGKNAPVSPVPNVQRVDIPLHERYKLLLASDGLWDYVSSLALPEFFKTAGTCQELIDYVLEENGSDNITVVYVVIDGDVPGATVAKTAQQQVPNNQCTIEPVLSSSDYIIELKQGAATVDSTEYRVVKEDAELELFQNEYINFDLIRGEDETKIWLIDRETLEDLPNKAQLVQQAVDFCKQITIPPYTIRVVVEKDLFPNFSHDLPINIIFYQIDHPQQKKLVQLIADRWDYTEPFLDLYFD